jgi:hypothetical protein
VYVSPQRESVMLMRRIGEEVVIGSGGSPLPHPGR